MDSEQLLLQKWRDLPPDKKQEVIDFVAFLESRIKEQPEVIHEVKTSTNLGEKLQKIRDKIVASGELLLTPEEVEREKAERRGGYQGD
ncbi:conserved hypothetical protein [Gloeothece citriformis PCC 7424]|uniref:Uncharacterized protein n=1 Tax=Gloeothece citriformis (strain PCC 7424) TaxID=65393 RepID=B7KCE7_GLOC7|nr:DUF2281 domain-containing protein [Gloeothece citriformis]ACK70252.1 conserved hypothetical protein [Gloeothece citriformis PCC 7424]